MSGTKQIPNVECDQASQRENPSQLLTIPSHDQTDANSNRPEGQTKPLVQRWSEADRSRHVAHGKHENEQYAQKAPDTSDPARGGCDRAGCHNLLLTAGTILLGRLASGKFLLFTLEVLSCTLLPTPLPHPLLESSGYGKIPASSLSLNDLEVKSLFFNHLARSCWARGWVGGLTPALFSELVLSKSADKWGWGWFEERLGGWAHLCPATGRSLLSPTGGWKSVTMRTGFL